MNKVIEPIALGLFSFSSGFFGLTIIYMLKGDGVTANGVTIVMYLALGLSLLSLLALGLVDSKGFWKDRAYGWKLFFINLGLGLLSAYVFAFFNHSTDGDTMKTMGIVVILIGLVALVSTFFTYLQRKERKETEKVAVLKKAEEKAIAVAEREAAEQ